MHRRFALRPLFWSLEGEPVGPYRPLFHFRRLWKTAVLLTLFVVLSPLGFMAVVDHRLSREVIERDIHYQTMRLVANTRQNITFFLSERKSSLAFIERDNTYEGLSQPLRLTALLDTLQKSFGDFTDLGVVNAEGLQHTYVGPYTLGGINYRDEEWFQVARETGIYISEVFLGFRRQPHLVVAVKDDLPNGSFYILRTSIGLNTLNRILGELEVSGQGDLFLVNREGVLQTPSRMFGPALEKIPLRMPPYADWIQVIEEAYGSETLVIGYAYIPDTPFVLLAVKNKANLMASWQKSRREWSFFLAGSVFAIVLVILGVSTHLVNQIYLADRQRTAMLHHMEYANKMASLGRLSAGIAHEINNPLAIINEKAGLIRDLFLLKKDYAEDPKLLALVDSIHKSVERCSRITRRLLHFARPSEGRVEELQIGEVIEEVLGFLGKEAEHRSIRVSVAVAPGTPMIRADRGRMQEIFLNLVDNAFGAMEDGGRLEIEARPVEGGLQVRVADNGCGIPAADLQRIFEPFFTTKDERGGTGLGLSITYGLVEEAGGRIEVSSEVGKGTEFRLFFPMTAPPARPKESRT
ncbi:MAG: ATP-binding protein [Desulfobacterales bacterium]